MHEEAEILKSRKEEEGKKQDFSQKQRNIAQNNEQRRDYKTHNDGKDREAAAAYAATADRRAKYAKHKCGESKFEEHCEAYINPIRRVFKETEDSFSKFSSQSQGQNEKINSADVIGKKLDHANDKTVHCKSGKKIVRTPPTMLKCTDVSFNEEGMASVELTWCSCGASFELRWKDSNDVEWNISSMISSTRVRKKNLKSGNTYEFRVRSIHSSIEKSPWSDSLVVVVPLSVSKPLFSDHEIKDRKENKYRVHRVHSKSGINKLTSEELLKHLNGIEPSTDNTDNSINYPEDETRNDQQHDVTSSKMSSSPTFSGKLFNGNGLKIDTNTKSKLGGEARKFQWSPVASKKVLEHNDEGNKGNLFQKRGTEFKINAEDGNLNGPFRFKCMTDNENIFTGIWMNKKLSSETIFRKRFVWIDHHLKHLYWSKQDDKVSADKKFVNLQRDVIDVRVSLDKRGFICTCKNSTIAVKSKKEVLFQFLSKARRESEVLEWVEIMKIIKNTSSDDAGIKEDSNIDDIENIRMWKKDHGRKLSLFHVNAPGSRQNYQHPVRIEPNLIRFVILNLIVYSLLSLLSFFFDIALPF